MEEVGVDPEEKPHCYSDVTAVGGAGIRGGEDEAVGILMEAVGAADLSGSDSDAGEEADDEILPLDTSEISRDPTQPHDSVRSMTTINKPKHDFCDIAMERFWKEHKNDKNWKSTVLDTDDNQNNEPHRTKSYNGGGKTSTEPTSTKPLTLPPKLIPGQQKDEVIDYLSKVNGSFRTRENYTNCLEGKIPVSIPPSVTDDFGDESKVAVVRSRHRFIIFLSVGVVLILTGLCMVFYTYTFYYSSPVRISGATLLNAGLLLEIFTIAGWNGGAF